jgi:hypothetical protein
MDLQTNYSSDNVQTASSLRKPVKNYLPASSMWQQRLAPRFPLKQSNVVGERQEDESPAEWLISKSWSSAEIRQLRSGSLIGTDRIDEESASAMDCQFLFDQYAPVPLPVPRGISLAV